MKDWNSHNNLHRNNNHDYDNNNNAINPLWCSNRILQIWTFFPRLQKGIVAKQTDWKIISDIKYFSADFSTGRVGEGLKDIPAGAQNIFVGCFNQKSASDEFQGRLNLTIASLVNSLCFFSFWKIKWESPLLILTYILFHKN